MVNKIQENSLGLPRGGRPLIASQGPVGILFEVNPQPVASFARDYKFWFQFRLPEAIRPLPRAVGWAARNKKNSSPLGEERRNG